MRMTFQRSYENAEAAQLVLDGAAAEERLVVRALPRVV
jgi:hypothetical protein